MATGLTFRLFGPLEVVDDAGRTLELGTRKQRALTAMLAVQPGRVVPLDRLIQELWSGEPPAGATRTLQSYIAHLRRVLEPARPPRTPPRVLLTREPGYLLAVAPGQVDLGLFAAWAEDGRQALGRGAHREAVRELDRALQLWRGDPLGEFADQEFARPVLARLTELRAVAVEDRFEASLALGEAATAVPGLEALVAAHPYRERAWGLLVLALYRAGRQADAFAALRRVRATLADDLGIEPGPELRAVERSVFDQDPRLTAPARQAVAAPTIPAVPDAAEMLVARDAQLTMAGRRLTEVRGGAGGVLLITGEAGIGKTRLAQAIADRSAAQGFRVVWGRCVEGTAPAFWPWTQVLRDLGADACLLADEPNPAHDPDSSLFRRYEEVVAALTATGEPLLVVLDDVHWADVSSLRLLTFVASSVSRLPVLLAATLRDEPGTHPEQLRETLAGLSRLPGTDRVALNAFTAEDVACYLQARNLAPEQATALFDRTGGNPFYLGEVLRLQASERDDPRAVPPGARDVINRRAARLPEETRTLLRAAAVVGRDVGIDVLEAATDSTAEQVMTWLEPAVAVGLLTEPATEPDYRFAHSLVCQAFYEGLSRVDRARLHLRVGEALEPVLPEAESAALAHHFAKAARVGGAAKAVKHAARAARHAGAHLAYTEAAQFWELALACQPSGDAQARCRLLIELGQARRIVGDAEAASRYLTEAIELAGRLGDRDAQIAAATAFGGLAVWHLWPYGRADDATVAVIEQLLAGSLDEPDRAALLGTLGLLLHHGPRREEGEQYAATAVEIARQLGDPALRARTLNNYLLVTMVPGRNAERGRVAAELTDLPGLPTATEVVARIFRMACLLRDGDLDEWNRQLDRCEQLLSAAPTAPLEAMVRSAQIPRCTLDARWDEAQSLVERFTELQFGTSRWGIRFRRLVTTYTCLRGQGRGAELLNDLVSAAAEAQFARLRPLAVLAAVEADRPELAAELITKWGTQIRPDWIADFDTAVWGLVAARLGTPDPASLYERLSPEADQLIVAGMGSACWGSAHTVLAELAARLDDRPRARMHAESALAAHRKLGLDYWTQQSENQVRRFS